MVHYMQFQSSLCLLCLIQLVVSIVVCQTVAGKSSYENSSEIHFVQEAILERSKCKSHFKKQTFHFHWKTKSNPDPLEVFGFFFPSDSALLNTSSSHGEEIIKGVLNTTCSNVNAKKNAWNCEIWLPAGIWIPLLAYQQSNITYSNSTILNQTSWHFSGVNLENRIVRSWIQNVSPKLFIAKSKAVIEFHGLALENSMYCQIVPRNGKPSPLSEAVIINSKLGTCQIEGSEGIAQLKISWDRECSSEFEIEFLEQPVIWNVNPRTLPRIGQEVLSLQLHSGKSDWRDSITLFLPKRVSNPIIRMKCGNHTSDHEGKFVILDDHDWLVNATLVNISDSLRPGNCNISLTLNGQDFFPTHQTVFVTGPEVEYVSQKVPVINGGKTKILVALRSPVSVPVSVSMELEFLDQASNKSDRFQLTKPTVHWKPGETGAKAFILFVGQDKEKVRFQGKLRQPKNCDLLLERSVIRLVTLEEHNIPIFQVQSQKVIYPREVDLFVINVVLVHGKSTLRSLLEYEINTKQLNKKCMGDDESSFLRESSGFIKWNAEDEKKQLPVHLNWENITFCDELEVMVTLKGVRMAQVKNENNTVARIYGTPEKSCPPGTVSKHSGHKFAFEPSYNFSNISLTEISIEGISMKDHKFYETELAPPYIATHHEYTAMIPHDVHEIKMKLTNQGDEDDIYIEDETCLIDEALSWEETIDHLLEAEVPVKPQSHNCSLQVWANNEVKNTMSVLSTEPVVEGNVTEMKELGLVSGFDVYFLKLSDPHVARLRSVEIRNSTHLVSFCGPKTDPSYLEELSKNDKYILIKGYPKSSCSLSKLIYINKVLQDDELYIIPRLEKPEILSTKVEVFGIFLRGFASLQNNHDSGNLEDDEILSAVAFDGVSMENSSFSFDIRVTAEDTVTSNLYRFVYGNPQSEFQLYPSGSSFDISTKTSLAAHNISSDPSGKWPVSPSQYKWCSQCSPGRFSVGVDTLECALCPPGHYASKPGSSVCLPCPPGTFAYIWGSQMCRPCMIGSAANKPGSEYCQLCPEGYMTDREGAAHCTVAVETTDLKTKYVVIASFAVVLNGTTLEMVERFRTGVSASGIMILKTLIRTDMADALNISVGDVTVKSVSSFGRRALLVNVDTAFKVDVDDDADQDEVDAEVRTAMLRGDDAVETIVSDPDRALKRTTKTFRAHARVDSNSTKVITKRPEEEESNTPWYTETIIVVLSCCVFFLSCSFLLCFYTRRRRGRGRVLPSQYINSIELTNSSEDSRNTSSFHSLYPMMRYRPVQPQARISS